MKWCSATGRPGERRFLIRVPLADATEPGATLEAGVRRVTEALAAASLPAFKIVDRELVSAAMGEDLQWRGIYATVASIVAITIYIAIRFRMSFAVGAIAATFHDVLVTLACLALAGYDLSLNVTAALLTVIGYSVNDTIVVFDRVRENAKACRPVARERRESQRPPDVVPHRDHGWYDAAVGAVAVSLRRRGTARLCVHDARRHRERHLVHGVHCLVDCDAVEPPHAAAAGRSGGRRPLGLTVSGQPTEVA